MYIKELFHTKKPVISFEIFPPKKDSPIDTIFTTIDKLSHLRPDFISVTYGAGGSTKDRTVEIATFIKKQYGIESLAHLTCITSTKEEIGHILEQLRQNGIDNILGLRGDLPQDPGFVFPNPLHYRFARELIEETRHNWDFCIGAACYPEGHTECSDPAKDLEYLREKVEAGADFLITQLFFDNDLLYAFMDKLAQYKIDVPVTAGILPVLNKKQIERSISLTRATLPKKFTRIMERYEHNPEALKEAGIAYATEQIIDLLSWGVDGIHLYTMNRPEVAQKIIENMASIRSHITR